jgi:hypothetical protein
MNDERYALTYVPSESKQAVINVTTNNQPIFKNSVMKRKAVGRRRRNNPKHANATKSTDSESSRV